MVKDPAQYRWSSYGEAVGGGAKGNGKKARAGLVRAMRAHKGVAAEANLWAHDVSREYRRVLLSGAVEKQETRVARSGETVVKRTRKGMSAEEKHRLEEKLVEIPYGRMLRCRVRSTPFHPSQIPPTAPPSAPPQKQIPSSNPWHGGREDYAPG